MLGIIMFIAGLAVLISGKMPSYVMGGPKYQFTGTGARILGLIMVFPILAAFFIGVVGGLFFGEGFLEYAAMIEFFLVVGAAIVVLVIGRFIRQPVDSATTGERDVVADLASTEAQIAHLSQGSLIYALLGLLGFTAIVVGPLAFIRASRAVRMIDEHQVGEKHRGKAQAARVLAVVIFLFYSAWAIFFFTFIMSY